MFNDKQKLSVYSKYNVSNVAKSEDFVHIIKPDKTLELYKQFEAMMNEKISAAAKWLSDRNIEYTWNEWIDGHLYRLHIPDKDLLFDFECYPVINMNYNYIRINYDTDIIDILERSFPSITINTQDTEFYRLNQKSTNKFLKENRHSPIYYKDVLRVALVKDGIIYQCMVLRQNKIIANVTKQNCSIPYGTYMLLRYLTEALEIPELIIKESCDNSYTISMYQLLNLPVIKKSPKRKIWWSLEGTCWHPEDVSKYVPFYFTEQITYKYTTNNTPLS